jgi:hypothetical protein
MFSEKKIFEILTLLTLASILIFQIERKSAKGTFLPSLFLYCPVVPEKMLHVTYYYDDDNVNVKHKMMIIAYLIPLKFLEEIGGHSVSGFRFSRRTFQDGLVSSRGEIFGSSLVYSNLSGQDLSHCSSIFTTARSSQLSSRCSTVRTSTHSSSTVLSSRALDPVFSGLGSLYSYPGSSLSSSVLVAAEGKCHDRVSPGISSSQSDPIHRRFPSGMGSLSGGSNCFRDVVFHPSERSHQSFRNEGSSVSSFSFQNLSGVPIYCLGNRQHNSDSLPEESGRNTLLRSVSAGQGCSDPMLSIPDSSDCETYSRPSERSCGLSFQVLSTSQYRVGTSSGSLSIYSSSLGKSQYRYIRNESFSSPQFQTSEPMLWTQ